MLSKATVATCTIAHGPPPISKQEKEEEQRETAIKEISVSLQTCWVLAWSRRAAGHSPLKPDSVMCAQGVWSGWWSAGQNATRLHLPWLSRYSSAGHWSLHTGALGEAGGRVVQGHQRQVFWVPRPESGYEGGEKGSNVWDLLPRMSQGTLSSSCLSINLHSVFPLQIWLYAFILYLTNCEPGPLISCYEKLCGSKLYQTLCR